MGNKRQWYLLVICVFIGVLSVFAAEPITAEKVVILPTATAERHAELGTYVERRLAEPFRYPYYEITNGPQTTMPFTRYDFAAVAEAYDADIVVGSELVRLAQFTRTDWNGDWWTTTFGELRVYAYYRPNDEFQLWQSRYSDTAEESVLNTPRAVVKEMTDRVLAKFPYQRIPSHRPRVSA